MRHQKLLVLGMLLLAGCATSGSGSGPKLKALNIDDALKLELVYKEGRSELMSYYSSSKTKDYDDGQIIYEKDEIVDFDVEDKTISFDKKNNEIVHEIRTIRKNGMVDLRDLAFPEVNETVKVILTPEADVVKYGAYPSTSVFYVPPIPLPKEPVKVGDTWELKKTWTHRKVGIPIFIELVTILKGIYQCGESRCADLELSGVLGIRGLELKGFQYKSEIRGRLVFDYLNGSVPWAEVHTDETIMQSDKASYVKSCMLTRLLKPEVESWGLATDKCDPEKKPPQGLPL